MKFYPIIDKVYRKNFHLIVNEDPKKFYEWICKHHKKAKEDSKLKEMILDCKGICIWCFNPYFYVFIPKFNWRIEDQACLTHELNHFVDFVFQETGIPTDIDNTEVRAYYFEYIFSECWTALKPKRK